MFITTTVERHAGQISGHFHSNGQLQDSSRQESYSGNQTKDVVNDAVVSLQRPNES